MYTGRLNAKEFAIANGFVLKSSSACSFGAVVGSLLRGVVEVFMLIEVVVSGCGVVVVDNAVFGGS